MKRIELADQVIVVLSEVARNVTATSLMNVPPGPKYVSDAFAPSTCLGNPANCAPPTAPSVATGSNPKYPHIFLAQILGLLIWCVLA
jgi:hypothetical protein